MPREPGQILPVSTLRGCRAADRQAGQGAIFKSYKGFPHGVPATEAATINEDILGFLKS
jgi:hypothetical protein